jgi:hypothetical protein
MEWKWTKGEPYERSRRLKHVQELENKQFSKEMDESAYTSSLNHDENTWDLLNQSAANSGFKVSNKREEIDSKMAGRDMLQQIGFNPFLGENNYINDISVRDQFLKPVNTTQGASRNQEEQSSSNFN